MNASDFWRDLESRLAKFDLLCHPFYRAWSAGLLRREELRAYATAYYPHVAAFPGYLRAFASRLPQSDLRQAVLENAADEDGASGGESHAELWLNFAEGMGAEREAIQDSELLPEMRSLIELFRRLAADGEPAEALAAFYAYESQVPRLAADKARGLRELYGADQRTRRYFTLHSTADVLHANVWKREVQALIEAAPNLCEPALRAGERAAQALWSALDGIERERRTEGALSAQPA